MSLAIFFSILCLMIPFAKDIEASKIEVMASIVPLGDFCERIGGNRVSVTVLIPPGASTHVFEPTPSTISRASKAKVFVQIGAGLEFWAEKMIRSSRPGNPIVVKGAEGIDLLRTIEKGHPGKKEEPHKGEPHHPHEGNPHIWLDPVLAKKICQDIGRAFERADPSESGSYRERLGTYLQELDRLDGEIRERVQGFRIKRYVTFHPAFSYFARRYGLEEVGIIEASPGREPTAKHLAGIVRSIKQYGIQAVFAEPQLNPRAAEVIAKEANVRVLILDPIGGRDPYGKDYLAMMRHNLSVMEKAMR